MDEDELYNVGYDFGKEYVSDMEVPEIGSEMSGDVIGGDNIIRNRYDQFEEMMETAREDFQELYFSGRWADDMPDEVSEAVEQENLDILDSVLTGIDDGMKSVICARIDTYHGDN